MHGATSWSDIAGYTAATGLRLTRFEAVTVRDLSIVYVNGLTKYKDQRQPPYLTDLGAERIQRDHDLARLRAFGLSQIS